MSRAPAIALIGGLDITSPSPLTRPGTLSDCENYEVANRRGLSRIDGFERFDGRPGVAEYRLLLLRASSISGLIRVGDRVQFQISAPQLAHEGIDGYVTSVAQANGGGFDIGVVFAGGMGDPALPDTLINFTATGSAVCTGSQSLVDPVGEQAAFDAALLQLANSRRAQITAVPGRAGSDVLGGFLFRNRTYAIRDLPRVFFEQGYYTDEDEGLHILIGGVEHRILDVRVLGDESGFVVYDPVPASGTDAVGVGGPVLTDLPVSGTLDPAFTGIAYADGLTVSGGVAPYFWSLAESDPGAPPQPEPGDLSEVVLQSDVTPAALWRGGPTGWQRVDLGREMPFTGGTALLRQTPRALNVDASEVRDSGWLFPTTSTINGTLAPNINADDGVTAALGGADGQTILCRGFNVSGIPEGAEIVGIEVRIERQSSAGGVAIDGVVTLAGITGGVDNKAGGQWPAALANATYGGASDLWGTEMLTREIIASPSFGALFVVRRAVSGNAIVATVDHVAIRVHYVERGGVPAWVWNGTSDVPITIIASQATSGDYGAGTAAGYLTIRCAVNSAKPRQIRAGDQIRNAPLGGGQQVGVVAARDRPIFLPGQFEIDINRSRYEWQEHNFFAQDRYAAMYGVSGAGVACSFDGQNLIRIRTQLSPGMDIPRHIAKHGDCLMLGYFSGAVVNTAVGNPLETRGEFGAGATELGDRLTALSAGGGDALICVCEKSTYLIRGLSPSVYTRQTVSATRGAIEYTLANPGLAIIADSFGLFGASTPESFAAASREYMSEPVQPWLRERLQATISNEQRFLRPVCAMAVRSKSQYRLYFRDGAVLTLTATNEGIEITRQRLTSGGRGISVRNIWTGIDASGRERVFASFAGAKQGLVFEVDVGRSFDGEPIAAFFVTNPITAGSISQLKQFDRMFYGGTGGYASLRWSFGVNEAQPEGRQEQSDLGRPSQPATSPNSRRRFGKMGSFDIGVEAYNLLLRVDSLTASEAPHSLQYIEPYINARADSRGHRGD